MTTKKIIDGLYFTVGMMLFNPATGESKTPDELNEDDRYTYDACMGAIELLKAQEPREPRVGRDGWYRCGGCNNPIASGERVKHFYGHPWPKYCEACGRAVKWE